MTQNIPTQLIKNIRPKIQSRLSILSKITHELKTPIHGIVGILNYLQENWDSLVDVEKRKHIDTVIEAGESLNDLLNLLLMNSGAKDDLKFNFEKTNLIRIIELAAYKYKNLSFAKNQIAIEFKTKYKKCYVKGDKFWISQLLMNLISNAVNYSREGKVTVSATIEKVNNIDTCAVSVQDEGVGIAAEELNSIFNPFYRGSNDIEAEGSGIGLAICKEIVEAHGGKISASNNEGAGSTVKFFIPII